MENAVKALEMAFAVMVFVMALSVSMFSFNSAKATSDIVLYAQDETNYYDYQEVAGKAAENRIVGIETIIPTLYKYYKENYTVVFRKGNYDESTGAFSNLSYLNVYTTKSAPKTTTTGEVLWGNGDSNEYNELMNAKYSLFVQGYNCNLSKEIFSFDLEEESLRHEPWSGKFVQSRINLDCFLNGTEYIIPTDNKSVYINYKYSDGKSFIERYKDSEFVETIGEYTYNDTQANGTEDGKLVKEKKKRVIIFTLINN